MTLIKTIPTGYHLISLGDQVLFQSTVNSHQSLAMNKTVLMNAIANLGAPQPGLAHERMTAPAQPSVDERQGLATIVIEPVMQRHDDSESIRVGNDSHDTEYLLQDVQDTLGSLTGMANRLAEQKKDVLKQLQALERRDLALQEKERQWSDKEQDVQQRHNQLLHEREQLAKASETSAQMISEHRTAVQQLAEGLEARERESVRLADVLQQENSRAEALSALLDTRLAQLQQRERQLQRKVLALHEDLKQLRKAKDRFGGIVKRFNLNVKLGSDPLTNTVKHQEEGT